MDAQGYQKAPKVTKMTPKVTTMAPKVTKVTTMASKMAPRITKKYLKWLQKGHFLVTLGTILEPSVAT